MNTRTRTGVPLFDSIAGGAVAGACHLLYGEVGAGKSTFALQFVARGLREGEPAVLVTRRNGRDVLQHAEALGFQLQPFIRQGALLLLEYLPEVVERVARAREVTQITDEFDYFARRHKGIRRIVFDPLTPLIQGMNLSEISFRARTLTQHLAGLGATTLLLLDLPEANDIVQSCKDLTPAILRFTVPSDTNSAHAVVMERFPAFHNGHKAIRFALDAGRGIVETGPESAPNREPVRRKILVAASDPPTVTAVRQILAEEYDVLACEDVIEAMARLGAENHDLLIVDVDARQNGAVRACLELRKNQFNLPILLLVRGQQKRLSDRLAFMAQGIDDCLEKPVDGRLLHVRVRALLRRYSPEQRFREQESDRVVLTGLKRFPRDVGVVTEAELFRACLEEEVGQARQFATPFCVCLFDFPVPENGDLQMAADVIQRLVRPQDKVYMNCNAVAVLLSETNGRGAEAFLRRVQAMTGIPVPKCVRVFPFDGSPEFVPQVLSHLPEPSAGDYESGTTLEVT